MPATNRLAASRIKNLEPGMHCDGAGLWLKKRLDGGAQWLLRVTVYGKRREMGLGGLSDVSLAEARREAERWRQVAKSGGDPTKAREAERRAKNGTDHTLAAITAAAFEAKRSELKGDGKAGRWMSPLEVHVLPVLGSYPISDIDQNDVARMLRPIWHDKPVAAKKAAQRLAYIMRWASATGHAVRTIAVDEARMILGKQAHVETGISAMNWRDVPDFYASLTTEQTRAAYALRITILTAMRSTPVRMCEIDEIDMDARTWSVPIAKMKGRKLLKDAKVTHFRQPLSKQALELMSEIEHVLGDHGLLIPGETSRPSAPRPISDMTMTRRLQRGGHEVNVHGFRSSFKTWTMEAEAAEDFDDRIVEMCLAHVTGSAVERAYMRSEFVEKRRPIMQAWADYVTSAT